MCVCEIFCFSLLVFLKSNNNKNNLIKEEKISTSQNRYYKNEAARFVVDGVRYRKSQRATLVRQDRVHKKHDFNGERRPARAVDTAPESAGLVSPNHSQVNIHAFNQMYNQRRYTGKPRF